MPVGRPPADHPRAELIAIRLTADERERLTAAAASARPPLTVSAYLRAAGLRGAAPCATSGVCEGCGACDGYVGSRQVGLWTPAGREDARYELREVGELITSHDPITWQPDPRYPLAVQERAYHLDANERAKVTRIADDPQPAFLLALNPTAVDGPPVVSNRGIVLGGNGRAMGLRLAYRAGAAKVYRSELERRAPLFGLELAQVRALQQPALVRVVQRLDHAQQGQLAAASALYNEGLGNALDERARAVSAARRLSPRTLEVVGQALEAHETLRAALAQEPGPIVRRLEEDGLVTRQNRAALVDAGGGLSEVGKQLVEGAFLGLVLGTPERLSAAAPATLQRVERLVPYLARVRARANGLDLIPLVQQACDVIYRARIARLPVNEYGRQRGLFAGDAPPAPAALELAELLEAAPLKRVSDAARKWAHVADYDPHQVDMFGRPPTIDAAREVLFRTLR